MAASAIPCGWPCGFVDSRYTSQIPWILAQPCPNPWHYILSYDIIWYYMIWYMILYDTIYDYIWYYMILYMIIYDIIWYYIWLYMILYSINVHVYNYIHICVCVPKKLFWGQLYRLRVTTELCPQETQASHHSEATRQWCGPVYQIVEMLWIDFIS